MRATAASRMARDQTLYRVLSCRLVCKIRNHRKQSHNLGVGLLKGCGIADSCQVCMLSASKMVLSHNLSVHTEFEVNTRMDPHRPSLSARLQAAPQSCLRSC